MQKEEEIKRIKLRFKEEKTNLLTDKKNLNKQVEDMRKQLDEAEMRMYQYKKTYEESSVAALTQEIAQK